MEAWNTQQVSRQGDELLLPVILVIFLVLREVRKVSAPCCCFKSPHAPNQDGINYP